MFSTIFTSMKNWKDSFIHKMSDVSFRNNNNNDDDENFDLGFNRTRSQEISSDGLDFSNHDNPVVIETNVIRLVLPSESRKEDDIPPEIEPVVDVYNDSTIQRTGGETPAFVEIELDAEADTEPAGEPVETVEIEEDRESCFLEFQETPLPSTTEIEDADNAEVILHNEYEPIVVEPTVENIHPVDVVKDVLDDIFSNIDLESQSKTQSLELTADNIDEIDQTRDMLDDFFSSMKTDFKSHSREHMVETMSKTDPEKEKEKESKFTNFSTIMRRKLRPHVKVSDNECICDICSFRIETGIQTLLPCEHGFHHTCLNTWLKYNQYCSICKVELTNDVPTKEYIQEKYSREYLLTTLIELGILESDDNNRDTDELIDCFIEYFRKLSEKKSISRKSSTDSLELLAVE